MQVSFHYLWYGTTIHDNMPTNDTNIEEIDVCASERSERADFFGSFTFKNCYFSQYFVGTSETLSVQNDILVGLHVPTDFQMYRQNSEKALLGGPPPTPPSSRRVRIVAHNAT